MADFVDMPKTKDAHGKETMDQILVMVDRFSKQVILAPIRNNFMTKEVLISFGNEYLLYSEYRSR
jgi:hypothetical protein